MKRLLIIVVFFITVFFAQANTFHVGSGQTYLSPNALYTANVVQNNDTILINSQLYSGQASLANWSKNNLVIKGINGKPHLFANSQNIGGKGIWIVSGNNIKIENIEFSGANCPDQNGAGIRFENNDVTIRFCNFHNNENGILTNNPYAGTVLIEHCEFGYNGFGDGFSHNVYIGHMNKLIFQYNYSHHAIVGHNLKSRANENIIRYNRIMDEATGNSSRIIDLSNGGFSIIQGNLLMQGPNAENNNMLGYGLEGLSNPVKELYIINNTFINKRSSCIFVSIASGATIAQLVNNIFGGIGTILNGTTTSNSNNYIETNIANLNFINEPLYDYHLTSTSPGINIGLALGMINGYNLKSVQEYLHNSNYSTRTPNNAIDIGAYEYNFPCSTTYTSYSFNGAYNNEWENAANWDNICVPPSIYSGTININVTCNTPEDFMLKLTTGANLQIKSGKIFTIK